MGSRRTTLAILVAVAVTVIGVDSVTGGATGGLGVVRAAVSTAILPFQRAADAVTHPLTGGSSNTRRLQRDNDRLRAQVARDQLSAERARQLGALGLLPGGHTVATGHAVAFGRGGGFERTVTIDVGRRDGVRTGMTVVADGALAGRVTAVGPFTAQALRLDDPTSAVGARVGGSGEIGLLHGDGSATFRLDLLGPGSSVHAGNPVFTGPAGQSTYVDGVPIGTVTSVSRAAPGSLIGTARVRPDAAPGTLDVLGVIVTPARTGARPTVTTAPSSSPSGTPR